MILPIVGYGFPVLRRKSEEISPDYPELNALINNMFETMNAAYGVGLAAPQIGLAIRLFIVDTAPFAENETLTKDEANDLKAFKKVFINAKVISEQGEKWSFNEGCLSIPNVREDVLRHEEVTITYQDEYFKTHTATYRGLIARVIQHEYDHIEGVLFTDHLTTFKKTFVKRKLDNIMNGKVTADYRMKFFKTK
jgi:peptide deformylase